MALGNVLRNNLKQFYQLQRSAWKKQKNDKKKKHIMDMYDLLLKTNKLQTHKNQKTHHYLTASNKNKHLDLGPIV